MSAIDLDAVEALSDAMWIRAVRVLADHRVPECSDAHHEFKDRHEYDQPCPARERILGNRVLLSEAADAMKTAVPQLVARVRALEEQNETAMRAVGGANRYAMQAFATNGEICRIIDDLRAQIEAGPDDAACDRVIDLVVLRHDLDGYTPDDEPVILNRTELRAAIRAALKGE